MKRKTQTVLFIAFCVISCLNGVLFTQNAAFAIFMVIWLTCGWYWLMDAIKEMNKYGKLKPPMIAFGVILAAAFICALQASV